MGKSVRAIECKGWHIGAEGHHAVIVTDIGHLFRVSGIVFSVSCMVDSPSPCPPTLKRASADRGAL